MQLQEYQAVDKSRQVPLGGKAEQCEDDTSQGTAIQADLLFQVI